MSRTRYRFYENIYPYFMTQTIVAWLPVFSRPELAEIVLDSWRFLQRERGIRIHGYVIMENHLHWIASGEQLAEQVGRFKSFTARNIIDELTQRGYQQLLEELRYYKLRFKDDQEFQLWQEGSHPQQITSNEMMWQKLEYTHHNPLRRGFVDEAAHWRYSSARNYLTGSGLLEIDMSWM